MIYDRHTESVWQKYEGQGIVGTQAGARLQRVPAGLESMQRFAERFPDGRVLVPADPEFRPYGRNPFTGYDRMPSTFRSDGPMPEKVEPMARVVAVGDRAWSLGLLRGVGRSEERTSELQSLMRLSFAVFHLQTQRLTPTRSPTP